MDKIKVGIIGGGFVGQAMLKMFPDAIVYDKHKPNYIAWYSQISQKQEQRAITMKDINASCSVAFVCVPTPCPANGKLDTSIVEEVVRECECPLIIMRSTVNPGTCDELSKKYKKNIVMVPEYVGETVKHPLLDESERPFIIMGGKPENCRKLIELYTTVYNANITIRQMTALEAEIVKLTENRAIAFKVSQCQELYDVCEKAGVDYYKIRDAVYGDDPRFNLWWTFVYPDKRGFKSKCIPKDIYAWRAWAESVGIKPELTKAMLDYNDKLIGA